MKTKGKLFLLSIILIFLTACDNSIERSDRTVTLIQENITAIVNELTEIQLNESNVQQDFEITLNKGDGLDQFDNEENEIFVNVKNRKEHLGNLEEYREEMVKLIEEISNQADSGPLPADQINRQAELLGQLNDALIVYIQDYQGNVETERIIYRSVANPEMNIDTFYDVFDSVQVLAKNNQMNLEVVLGYFEPINTQLVNFKVYLANLNESQN